MAISKEQPMRPALSDVLDASDALETTLNAEIDRSTTEDIRLNSAIETETQRAQAAEQDNASAIETETQRAQAAENVINETLQSQEYDIKTTGNSFFFDFETVFDIEMPELATRSTQGACCDDNGYMYVFSDKLSSETSPALLWKINIDNPTEKRYIDFSQYPNVGHGNSITFDPINQNIVIISSNGYMTIVNTNLEIMSHVYMGSDDYAGRYSQIMLNDKYGVLAVDGTPIYRFFKRLGEDALCLIGEMSIEQSRGLTLNLQDAVIHENVCYVMSSFDNRTTVIDVFTVTGNVMGKYVVNDSNNEYEGLFVYGNNLYITTNSRSKMVVKRCSLLNFPTFSERSKDTLSPNMKIIITRRLLETGHYAQEDIESYVKYRKVNVQNSVFTIAERVPQAIWDINNYNDYNYMEYFFSIYNFLGSKSSNHNLRFYKIPYTNDTYISLNYTVSNDIQYLSRVEIFTNNGSRGINFQKDDANFDSKIVSLFDQSENVHLPVLTEERGIYPLGLQEPNFRAKSLIILKQA